jgi:alpha(1,3/1,4) fucosyltransferase
LKGELVPLTKPVIKLRLQNGLDLKYFKKEVFDIEGLSDIYDFEESSKPDVIIFGPYGNDIPAEGNYIRVGYFCENITPELSICDWAFGVPHESEVKSTRYKRIQWHGTDPNILVKPANYNAGEIFKQKKHFCNFLYSHQVPYREEFFRQLSKYKKVDAPGKSMNNMASIDTLYSGNIWERKRQFLSKYKFTIAFENYVYPGYQTEKLYDAMQSDSIPIYCGDPGIGEIFNTSSFINAGDIIRTENSTADWLQRRSQMDFIDILPTYYHAPQHRIKRKLKAWGRGLKMKLQFSKLDFSPLIERIIELDNNDEAYISMLQQPWFNNNQPPSGASNKQRWMEIFSQIK